MTIAFFVERLRRLLFCFICTTNEHGLQDTWDKCFRTAYKIVPD